MVSTKLLLKTEKRNRKGLAPLYLRVTVNRQSVFINTNIKLDPVNWNAETQTILKGHGNSTKANNQAAKVKVSVIDLAFDLDYRGVRYTAKSLKDKYLNNSDDDVIQIATAWIERRRAAKELAPSSYEKFRGIINKVKACSGSSLSPHELDKAFLDKFKRYLINLGNSENTITSNLSFLRSVCNYLISIDAMSQNDYPFRGRGLSYSNSKRKHLNIEQLSSIRDLVLPHGSKLKESRDIFLFCTQTGLRIGDALNLRCKDFDSTHIYYDVKKTGDHSRLKCTTLAQSILEEYSNNKPNEEYIFNFLTRSAQIDEIEALREKKSATALINKNLGIISTRAGLEVKISTHWARHSLAVNGLMNGLSTEDIKGILNHKDIKTTQIYAKIVDAKKDQSIDKLDSIAF